jgi:hypothetical protein
MKNDSEGSRATYFVGDADAAGLRVQGPDAVFLHSGNFPRHVHAVSA